MLPGTRPAKDSVGQYEFPLNFRDLLLWPFGRRKWFRVSGDSMRPTFVDGDFVLVNTAAYRTEKPVVGDVVVARHPYRTAAVLIKRVAHIEKEKVDLLGDSSGESTDSRALGRFGFDSLIGRVVGRLS